MGKNYLLFLRISIHYFFFFLQVCQPEPLTVFFSCCGTCNVSLNTAVVQCWKTERWLIWTQAGLVALVFDWLVHIEMMGHQKKKHNTFGVQVTASLGVRGAFTQRFPGQSKVFSCLRTSGQGMKSVCGKEMRPLSKWINQCQVLRRNGIEFILFPCKSFVQCRWFSSLPRTLYKWASMKCMCRNWDIVPLYLPWKHCWGH